MTQADSSNSYTRGPTAAMPGTQAAEPPPARAHRGAPEVNAALLAVWQPSLKKAADESQVVAVIARFLDTWRPEELDRLPEGARPGRIADIEDINELAFMLVRAHCRFHGTPDDERLLLRMLTFLTHAATRLAQIAAQKSRAPANAESRDSWN